MYLYKDFYRRSSSRFYAHLYIVFIQACELDTNVLTSKSFQCNVDIIFAFVRIFPFMLMRYLIEFKS